MKLYPRATANPPTADITLYECHRCHSFTAATGGSCLECGALNLGPTGDVVRDQINDQIKKSERFVRSSLEKSAKRLLKKGVKELPTNVGGPAVQLISLLINQLLKGKP